MIEILDMGLLDNFRIEVPLGFYIPYLVVLASGLMSWLGRLDYLAMEWARKHSL
jgi:hypothetical protein|tara:strand:- start:552 stop:713 length:162 start_codon:yes stop_codon:yes gene_type:complete